METQLDPSLGFRAGPPRLDDASDDVPVMRLLDLLWRGKGVIALAAVAGAVIGLGLTFVFPSKYTSTASFMAEAPIQSSSGSLSSLASTLGGSGGLAGLSGLAGQFGITLPALGGSTQSPDYFVSLLGSRMVRDSLLAMRFAADGREDEQHGRALVDLLPLHTSDPALRRERGEKMLSKMIGAEVDRKASVVTFSVTDRQPRRAAELASRALAVVNWYNVTKRQSRSRQQREFVERRLREAQRDLEQAEGEMEAFLARNRVYSMSPTLQFEYARLQRLVQQKQELTASLLRAYEEARIAEAGNMPVLSVIDPAQIPVKRSFPSYTAFGLLGVLLGGLAGIGYLLAGPMRRGWQAIEVGDALHPLR